MIGKSDSSPGLGPTGSLTLARARAKVWARLPAWMYLSDGIARSLLAVVVAFAACATDTAHYGSPRDDTAMAAIASAWAEVGTGGLALSLCEDTARSAAWAGPDGCQIDHALRGSGLGLVHDVRVQSGGGGCPHRAVAFVVGTASGGGLAALATVQGQVSLQSSRAEDPYAFPYTLQIACDGRACGIPGSSPPTGTSMSRSSTAIQV